SGEPIKSAINISSFIKKIDPEIFTVWGGPHATYYPESIFECLSCDFVISGFGSKPLYKLYKSLLDNKKEDFKLISGLSYKIESTIHRNSIEYQFEHIHFKDIPYNLIKDYSPYGQLNSTNIIFPIYSIIGCAYNCTFCSSPAYYKNFPHRCFFISPNEVIDHIIFLLKRYQAKHIYFIDDDSFINLKHIEDIIDLILQRKIKVKLGFRGARINEIKKMSSSFLKKLEQVGVNSLHVGAESGSNYLLNLIKKDCCVNDILECNKKLSAFNITIYYNFILGIPGERTEDIKDTISLMFKLIKENKNCIILSPNRFRPVIGSELSNSLIDKYPQIFPKNLAIWSEYENDGQFGKLPWIPNTHHKFHDMIALTCYFIDDKYKFIQIKGLFSIILKFSSAIYAPIARFRLRHGLYHFFLEKKFYYALKYIY
ncbi:MAG: B12-binding domain-containing radical SAM protein, partial [Oligoflexia bacterium]|nr:B12-binding domain-containing radical SAM protein [Oligoflexia bacterium]